MPRTLLIISPAFSPGLGQFDFNRMIPGISIRLQRRVIGTHESRGRSRVSRLLTQFAVWSTYFIDFSDKREVRSEERGADLKIASRADVKASASMYGLRT